ncbi:FxsA family protein [Planctomycetes bacterium K23_9]|uniref:Phage T7 F exclusion suppressor FxsA n=1 Tax=Stieleria marina TaxID=1930275 RepID=A0A517NPX1_9BACT|nr:phage T7 F exclusion suppressor FxsA [Planctomycetes bacterium K23_9]
MFFRLLAAFIVVPLVELYLLLQVADATSVATTFLIVIGTGILGSWLARREGAMAWYRFQEALGQGRAPSKEIQDGLMIVFAAALLLTPGLLTDAVGFTLLIPPGRALVRRFVLSRYLRGFKVQVGPGAGNASEEQPASFRDNARPGDDGFTIDAKAVHRS